MTRREARAVVMAAAMVGAVVMAAVVMEAAVIGAVVVRVAGAAPAVTSARETVENVTSAREIASQRSGRSRRSGSMKVPAEARPVDGQRGRRRVRPVEARKDVVSDRPVHAHPTHRGPPRTAPGRHVRRAG